MWPVEEITATKDETYTAIWTFKKNAEIYKVDYKFISGTEGKDLPDKIGRAHV